MSFGQEVKDFASAFKSSAGALESYSRSKYYDKLANADSDKAPDFSGFEQFSKDNPGATADDYLKQGKKKKHGPLHNVGRLLGLNSDDDTPAALPGTPATLRAPDYSVLGDEGSTPDEAWLQGMSQGGAVKPVKVQRFALGGPVGPAETDEEGNPMAAAPAPAAAPPPPPASPIAAPAAAPAAPAGPPPEEDPENPGNAPPDALHAGLSQLKKNFQLDKPDPATGIDHEKMAGQKALMNGVGRPSDRDMDDAAEAVGIPDRHIQTAEANLRIMDYGYKWYLQHGDIDKANNFAASILQYATHQAAAYGTAAIDDLRRGNIHGAVDKVTTGYNAIPNGKRAESKVLDNGHIDAKVIDIETGKVVSEHTITPQQLYQGALSLSNKSGAWQAIIEAASERRGLTKAPASLTDADVDAISSVHGVNADGSPIKSSGTAPAGGAPSQDTSSSATVTPSGNQDVDAAIASLPEYQRPYAARMAAKEASNNPNAVNPKNPGSVGLFQFTPDTWETATGQKIDPKLIGTPQDPRKDTKQAVLAMRALTAKNETAFKKKFNRDPSPADLAVMHQQGTTGGISLISANPDEPATKYVSAAALKQNGVDPKATAGQAVDAIKKFYFPAQHAASKNDPLTVNPMEEKQEDAPKFTHPEEPEWLHPDAEKLAQASPEGRKIYMQQIREENARRNQEWTKAMSEAKTDYAAKQTAYTAAQKAERAEAMKPIPTAQRAQVNTDLKAAEEDEDVKSMFIGDDGKAKATPGAPKLNDVRPIAFDLYARNQMTEVQAYQLGMLLSDPTSKSFKLHDTPSGLIKIKTKGGDWVVSPNTLAVIKTTRENLAKAAQMNTGKGGANWKETGAAAVKAGKATGNIAKNGYDYVMSGDMGRDQGAALTRGAKAIPKLAGQALDYATSGISDPFLTKDNREGTKARRALD